MKFFIPLFILLILSLFSIIEYKQYKIGQKIIKKEDTTSIQVVVKADSIKETDCDFQVKYPYYLIRFSDGNYSILYINNGYGIETKWYITAEYGHDFSMFVDGAERFKDSCSAKYKLKKFLIRENKLNPPPDKYKIIK